MYYYYKKAINTESFNGTKKVLIAYLDKTQDSVVLPSTLLKNVEEHYGVRVACVPGSKAPLLVVSDDADNVVDITKIWNVITANLRKIITGDQAKDEEIMGGPQVSNMIDILSGKLAAMFNGDTKLSKRIVLSVKAEFMAEEIIGGVIELNISDAKVDRDFYEETTRLIKSTQNLNEAELKNKNITNQTVKQINCEDTLFIKIPSTRELTGTSEFGYSIPEASDVSIPYKGDESLRRVGAEDDVINVSIRTTITGRLENNKDPEAGNLYPNEQNYYEELQYALQKATEASGLPTDVLPQEAQNYLLDLAEMFYVMHWAHSPRVPDIILNSEDDGEEDSDTIIGKYASKSNSGKTTIDACIYLREFLIETAAKMGPQVYISAIVQLARWGSRKQTSIVFANYDLRFDLYDGLVRDIIGNVSDYETEKTTDGKDMRLSGIIFPDIEFQDITLGFGDTMGLPVGVVLTQQRKNNKTGKSLTLRKCLHIVDLLQLIDCGDLQVDGITVENGTVRVDIASIAFESYGYAMDACMECSKRYGHYNTIIVNDDIAEIFSDIPGIKAKPSALSIMSELRAAPMLLSKVKMIKPGSLQANIGNRAIGSVSATARYFVASLLLPVYERAIAGFGGIEVPNTSRDNYESDMVVFTEKALNSWAQAVSGFKYKQSLAAATAFTSTSQSESQPESQPVQESITNGINWIGRIEDGSRLFRVAGTSGNIVAYCYMAKVNSAGTGTYTQYTLTTKTDGRDIVMDDTKILTLDRVAAVILHNIVLSMKGAKISQVLFETEEDLMRIRDLLNVRK